MLFFAVVISSLISMVIIPKAFTTSMVIIVGLWLVYDILKKTKHGEKFRFPIFARKMAPFYIWLVASCLWSINDAAHISFALIRSLLAFEFGVVISYFCQTSKQFDSVMKGFVCGGLISSVVVLTLQHQLIGITRLGNKIYGSAMEFSGGLIISIIASIILFTRTKSKIYLIFSICFLILCALSGSRSAIVIPIIYSALFYVFFKQKILKIVSFAILLIAFSLGFLYATQKIPVLYDVVGFRVEQLIVNKNEDGSYKEREIMKQVAIEAWLERPICGYGLYGFGKKLQEKHGLNLFAHCDYAEVLSCFGIIGAALFYIPLIRTCYKKKNFVISKGKYYQSALFAYACILIIRIGSSIYFISIRDMIMISLIFSFLGRPRKLDYKQC